ncbi:MAG: cytochrome c biogenesis protein ResB [Desulfuromonadales bacterium]|nr:cytochrome c biogenesis protein ResB [Desulfuromonadales bacterium]
MSKQSNPVDRLWDFFCSLKLTITILILLATTSIIGTVIQQNLSPQEYMQKLGMSESTYNLFNSLQFFDMYHSYWFLSLLGLFAVNLICCSIKRFPHVWKTVREPVLVADDGLFKTFSNLDEVVADGSMESVREKVTVLLSKKFTAPVITEQDGKIHFFSQKAAYARFGVYVTHLSILIIFVGAMIGNVWGFKAFVNIVEGTFVDSIWGRSDSQTPIPLGFEVHCEDFEVTFYEDGRRPKDYVSKLVVKENGQEVLRKTIEVNDPLQYKGLTFYQASYGQSGDPVFRFRVQERATGETVEVVGRQGKHLPLPGGAALIPMGYASNYQSFGPAAQVNIDVGDHQHGNPFIVLQQFANFDEKRGGAYIVTLLEAEQDYYTGLSVTKDPGVWVVWIGCFLMVFGSLTAFFLSHRRIWVTLQPLERGIGVKVGGVAHRNQPAFSLFFDELIKDFNDTLVEK